MKTLTMNQGHQHHVNAGQKIVPAMAASIREALALLGAVTAATAVILLSVWVAGLEMTDVLGAGIWGVGFIFLGIGVDNRDPGAFFQVLSGLALFVLAWLQTNVSPDFAIVSGILVAAWVAAGLFKRLR